MGLTAFLTATTCEDVAPALPTEAEARAHYESVADLQFRMSGNVLEIVVNQPLQQVRRGGALWAKVGPYVYLFTEETQILLRRFPGLSGVRVITQTSRRNTEVARAFLRRNRAERTYVAEVQEYCGQGPGRRDKAPLALRGSGRMGRRTHGVPVPRRVRGRLMLLGRKACPPTSQLIPMAERRSIA